jgi:hypothetical protein
MSLPDLGLLNDQCLLEVLLVASVTCVLWGPSVSVLLPKLCSVAEAVKHGASAAAGACASDPEHFV